MARKNKINDTHLDKQTPFIYNWLSLYKREKYAKYRHRRNPKKYFYLNKSLRSFGNHR